MTASSSPTSSETRAALMAGIGCYLLWGFIPLVFQQMAHQGADAWEIMGHRAVWGVICIRPLASACEVWSTKPDSE